MNEWCVCWNYSTNSVIACTSEALIEINNERFLDNQPPLSPLRTNLQRHEADRVVKAFWPYLSERVAGDAA